MPVACVFIGMGNALTTDAACNAWSGEPPDEFSRIVISVRLVGVHNRLGQETCGRLGVNNPVEARNSGFGGVVIGFPWFETNNASWAQRETHYAYATE